jgi:hypothetical protein
MLVCAKCHSGELEILSRGGPARNSFDVRCLNNRCNERYVLRLGLGDSITQIAKFERTRRPAFTKPTEDD